MKMDGGSKARAAQRGGISYHRRTLAEVTKATNAMPAGTQMVDKSGRRSLADVTTASKVKPC